MDSSFSALLTSRITECVADLRYTHKPTGTQKAPQVIELMLPKKERSQKEAEDFPLVRWAFTRGEFARMRPAPFGVKIDAGIYTNGSITDGNRDITELIIALGKLVEKPWYKPYKLLNPVTFTVGSTDKHTEGIQPHPYYWAALHLEFSVATGHGG